MLISTIAPAQILRFTSQAVSLKTTDSYDQWRPWEEWEKSNVLITMDIDKDVIHIYSKREQRYDIISYSDKIIDEDSESVVMDCIDEEGIRCTVKIMRYDDYSHIYIKWSNMQYVYQVVAK